MKYVVLRRHYSLAVLLDIVDFDRSYNNDDACCLTRLVLGFCIARGSRANYFKFAICQITLLVSLSKLEVSVVCDVDHEQVWHFEKRRDYEVQLIFPERASNKEFVMTHQQKHD